MKPFLVIDIGNSQTKWAVADSRGVRSARETHSTRPGLRKIRARGCDLAVVCSVVPALNQPLRRALKRSRIRKIVFISARTNLGIGVRYPEPATIGADRLANAVAAAHLVGTPAVVIDFGTAVTFDVVSARGDYLGGVICPGLKSMTDYLHEQTALLPKISLREPKRLIGKSTLEAMRAGAVVGYRGLIDGILSALKKELRAPRLYVVATGGHSRLIARKLRGVTVVRPKLTLEGLRLIGIRLRSAGRP